MAKNEFFKRFISLLLATLITMSTIMPTFISHAENSDDHTTVISNSQSVILEESDYKIEGNIIVGIEESGKAKITANPNIQIKNIGGVTEIGENAFKGLKLNSVIIGDEITKIGSHAFQNTGIKNLTLKPGIKEIGDYAFADNEISKLNIEDTLDTIGIYSFHSNNLTNITINAKNIGKNAFSANKLTEVILNNTVDVGNEAFIDNPDLNKVTVGTQNPPVTLFKENTFDSNGKPVEVYIKDNGSNIDSLDKNKYLVNLITVKLSIIDLSNNGLIKEVIESKHQASEFPIKIEAPKIKGYETKDDDLVENKITLNLPDVGYFVVEDSIDYIRINSPRIIVEESKQLIYKKNKSLDIREILKNIVFLDKDGNGITALKNNTDLNSNIRVNPSNINAPNKEAEVNVEITLTDPDTELSDNVNVKFKFSDIDLSEEEIIEGKGWLYKDFEYSGTAVTGLSQSGKERLKTNKNLVLPGQHPQTGEPIKVLNNSAFSNQLIDTVDFEKMENLETIDMYVFSNSGITSVLNIDKANKLKYIRTYAFYKNKLKFFDFESLTNLESIDNSSFYQNNLEEVCLTDLLKLKYINNSAFYGNKIHSLKLSNLPELTRMEDWVFSNNQISGTLELDNIPKLERIPTGFVTNNKIENVEFRNLDSLTSIGDYAFRNNKIESVNMSSLKNLVRIDGEEAFANNKIKLVEFSDLENLENINGFKNNEIDTVTFKNLPKLKFLGSSNSAFNNNKIREVELVDLPALEILGSYAFYNNPNLRVVTFKNLPKLKELRYDSFSNSGIEEITFENIPSIEKIGGFSNNKIKKLELVNLPKLKEITGYAFNSNKIEELKLENLPELIRIKELAFNSNKISEFNVKNLPKLEVIENYGFGNNIISGTVDLTQLPELREIGSNSFHNNKITELKINGLQKLQNIKHGAFRNNRITSIVLKDLPELINIEGESFDNNRLDRLEIKGLSKLEKIGHRAFGYQNGGNSLRSIKIEDNTKLKSLSGFAHNNKLSEVTLSNLPELEEIGDYAFYECSLFDIDLRPFTKLKRIGKDSFSDGYSHIYMNRLKELKLPNSIEEISYRAFRNNEITNIDLSTLTNLKKIEKEAFDGNGIANDFKLPETENPIELEANIASVKEEHLDFRKNPNVKLKLLSAKPFVTAGPLTLKFNNENQIDLSSITSDLDPKNPTIIYIDNVTNPDKFNNLPAGIVVNPKRVVVKHELEDGTPMPILKDKTVFMPRGTTVAATEFSGYRAVNIKTNPNGFATFDSTKGIATANDNVPESGGELTFIYKEAEKIENDNYKITINRTRFTDREFYYPNRTLSLEAFYDLKNIDIENEKNVKLVIQLPEYATRDSSRIGIPKKIEGVKLAKDPYYDANTKQIVYVVEKFDTQAAAINIRVDFQFGIDTPQKSVNTAKAMYILEDGRQEGPTAVSQEFVPKYTEPNIGKVSLGDNDGVTAIRELEDNGKYANVTMTYGFDLYNLERRLNKIIIKDTLPTYKKYSDNPQGYEIVTAEFNPIKNPGWKDNKDGTVTYEFSEEELLSLLNRTKEFYLDYSSARLIAPKLILDLPKAIEQNDIINRIDYTIGIDKPKYEDKVELKGKRERRRSISFYEVNPFSYNFSKIGNETLQPYDDDNTVDHPWRITLTANEVRRTLKDKTEIYVPKISNIEIWEYGLEYHNQNDRYFEYTYFKADRDVKISLYSTSQSGNENLRETWNKENPDSIHELKAGEKLILTPEQRINLKRAKFEFKGVELVNLEESINVDVGTKLINGKVLPNDNKYFYNYSRFFADSRIEELNLNKEVTEVKNAYKILYKASKRIGVTKTSNISNNDVIRDTDRKIDYKLGYTADYTVNGLKGKYYIKDFELVDVFPRELEIINMTINPKFLEAGGRYIKEDNGEKGSLLKFKAPYLINDLEWIAKIETKIKSGSAGDAEFTNRAYINFTDDSKPGEKTQILNPADTPEEQNQPRSTAKHSLRLSVNDSLVGKKFIRKSSINGAWTDSINTIPEEEFEYKLVVSNNLPVEVSKIRLFDIFPAYGDRYLVNNGLGIRDNRLSDFSNTFVDIESIRVYDYKTKTYRALDKSNYPVKLLSKTDDFPRTFLDGTTKSWVDKAISNPIYQTSDKSNALGIYIGGNDNSTIPAYSQLEVVLRMKAPSKSLQNVSEWDGKIAKNTFAYFYEGSSRYSEVIDVSNTLKAPKKNIKFKKVDKSTGKPLSGAIYKLIQDNTEKIATSGPDGYVYFNDIEYKDYRIIEEFAPSGYKVNLDEILKKLNYDNYISDLEELKNNPNYIEEIEEAKDERIPEPDNKKYTININKVDGLSRPIANVKFRLEKAGTKESYIGITDRMGKLTFGNLISGQYRLIEEGNLNRFTVIKPVLFELPLADDYSSNSISNLTKKIDENDSNHTIYDFKILNEKFELDLYKLGIDDITGEIKANQTRLKDGKRLSGVDFRLYETNKNIQNGGVVQSQRIESEIGYYTTDRIGKIKLNSLIPNVVYRLEELNTPDGYENSENIEFYLDESGVVRTLENETFVRPDVLIVLNKKKLRTSSIEITKIDSDNKNDNTNKLAGATFQLFKLEGNTFVPVPEEDINNKKYTKVTDDKGKILFEDIKHGVYEVREILAPSGYIQGSEPIQFTVNPFNSKLFKKTVKNKKIGLEIIKVEKLAGPFENQELANQKLEELKLQREDDGDLIIANKIVYKKLKGAEFELSQAYSQKNSVVEPEIKPSSEHEYSIYKYGNGLSEFGSYKLSEIKAPEGFKKFTDKVIKLDTIVNYNNPELKYYVENTRIKGQINITKFENRKNKVLSGVTFKIYKGILNKNELTPDKLVYEKTTDKDGIIRILNVDLGDYTIVETNAPQNYNIVNDVVHVKLTGDNPIVRKSFYNSLELGTLKLKKVDDLGNPILNLKGSEFKLFYDGVEHSTGTISINPNEVGIIKFENVPVVGDYKIKEVKAPENYVILDSGEITFSYGDANPLNDSTEPEVMKNKLQTEIVATKTWVGGNESLRPNVFFKLFREVEGGQEEELAVEKQLIGKTDKTVNFGKFDKYQHSNGQVKEYKYFVKEVNENGEQIDFSTTLYRKSTDKTLEVINTYESPKTELTAIKTWKGGEAVNKPNLKFKLFRKIAGGQLTEVLQDNQNPIMLDVPKPSGMIGNLIDIITGEKDNLEVKFKDLPVTDSNANEYIYFVKEVKEDGSDIDDTILFKPENGAEKEAAKVENSDKLKVTFNNIYESPKKTVEATKEWKNGPNNRPEIYFKLFRSINNVEEEVSTIKKVEGDKASWQDLAVTDDSGVEYTYFVREVNSAGEDVIPENYIKFEDGLKVVNTYVSPKIATKTVTKEWDLVEGENKPQQVEITLFRRANGVKDSTFSQKLILSNANDWTETIKNLDKTDIQGVDYEYFVEEKAINGFTVDYGSRNSDLIVTNTQNVIEKTVEKEWINATDVENPSKVEVVLLRNNEKYKSIELSKENSWRHTFGNLPEYDENGMKYNYVIEEKEVKGYTSSVNQNTGKIINTKKLISLEVVKSWVDEGNNLDKPDEITVKLYRNGSDTAYKTAKISGNGNEWRYTFENLPQYDVDGNEYEYTIDEEAIAGYEKIVKDYSITNTRKLVSVPVIKNWENIEEIYPNSITFKLFRDGKEIGSKVITKEEAKQRGNWNHIFEVDKDGYKLPKTNPKTKKAYNYTVSEDSVTGFTTKYSDDTKTITNTQDTKEITLRKIWQNGPKPEAQLILKRRVEGVEDNKFSEEFNATITNPAKSFTVPKYNGEGKEFEYYVVEPKVADNYTSNINKFDVTNSFSIPTGEVSAKKIWMNGTSIKPEVNIKLFRTLGENTQEVPNAKVVDITRTNDESKQEIEVNWDNIELTDINGNPYTFSVREFDKDGSEFNDNRFEISISDNKLEITNSYRSLKVEKTVEKKWNLVEGELLPEKVVAILKRYTADENAKEIVKEIELKASNNWTYVFDNLDKTDINGNEYKYILEEKQYDAYNSKVKVDEKNNKFIIENTSVITEIDVNKKWINNTDDENPQKVTVRLYRNGSEYKKIDLSELNKWQYKFTNLPKFDENGALYNYEIREDKVNGYTSDINQVSGEIVNTKETIELEVSKKWIDEANSLDKPEEITVNLYRNGENTPYKTAKLKGEDWKYVFENLPKKDLAGNEYIYTVDEEKVAGYEKTIDDYSITNTRILEKVKVTKNWENVEEIYPEGITFRLFRDGKEIGEHTVIIEDYKNNGNWNYVFEKDRDGNKLPKTNPKTEKDYVYTVEEDEVKGYETKYSKDKLEITNIQKTREIKVEKIWENGPKPEATIYLKRKVVMGDKEVIDEEYREEFKATVTEPSKTYKVTTHNGKGEEFIYYVEEAKMENYKAKIEGFKVTNKYIVPKIEVIAKLIWVDAPKPNKPNTWVKLYRKVEGTEKIEEVPEAELKKIITEGVNEVEIKWTELDGTDISGNPYEFLAIEVDETGQDKTFVPSEFTKTEKGLVIVNKYIPPVKEENINEDKKYIPKTGISRNTGFEMLSLISIMAMGYGFYTKKRNKKSNL